MGLFVKHAVHYNSGYMAKASSGILEGMVVAIETNSSTGEIQLAKADRNGVHTSAAIAGLAGDDAYNSGNTMVVVDPVYQVVMAKPARRIGDYLDTTITNTTNWTDSGTSKRGVTVFSVAGEFASDQYVSTASASQATTADAGAAPAYAINDGWTWGGSGTNAAFVGKLIDDGGQSVTILARLTGAVSNSLLPFRWVFNGA
jgi:hypothetical protein